MGGGGEDPNTTISVPNGVSLACHNGPTLNAGLVALWTSIAKKPYITFSHCIRLSSFVAITRTHRCLAL